MPTRQTIGMSLACLLISAGAVAKTPEETPTPELGPHHHINSIASCAASHTCHSVRHGRRVRHWEAARDDTADTGEAGPADAYPGPVHPTGPMQFGSAAWYNWVGSRTASGEILDSTTATAAHRSLPLASYAKVTNLDTGRAVVVRINDRGPWSHRFIIDLSPRAAEAIGIIHTGVAAVVVEPVASGMVPSAEAASSVGAF
jgi:rare lipoprotein A